MKCLTLSFSVLGTTTTLLSQIVFQFAVLLQLTQEDWNNLLKNQETQIITYYIEISRKFTLAYLYCTLVITSCYALTPIATHVLDIKSPLNQTKPRKLFYPAEYLVNQEKYYYVLLLSEYVGYILCVLIGVTTDITYFLLLEYTCGMHAVLCHRLEILNELYKLEWVDSNQSDGSNGISYRVRRCIQLDKRIKVYIKEMESTFATNLLIDIAVGAVFYICTCIMIVIRARRLFEIFRLVAVAILYTSRFFLISWTGQRVIDHSSEIPTAVYDCVWYRMPVEIQKMLMLLIVRSQRPSRMILAGIYIINLESFTSVMRTSVSYCTVMISLRPTMENI
ncbi:odorant receptor 85f-like [Odontomachus brunneus]|uniref:odorant receptor 85f-like n=1 Tax=Odontomachus brunneus TaxID=486640 RepID=UPI0013F1AB10|nr:odorant receptor 85f-like [Odontomachus brunneus]